MPNIPFPNKLGLITGLNMITNKKFYQIYRICDGEIIKTFNTQEELNNYIIDHPISKYCEMFPNTYTIKEEI